MLKGLKGYKIANRCYNFDSNTRSSCIISFVIFQAMLKLAQKWEYWKLQLGILFVNQLVFQAPCISVIKYVDAKYRIYFHFSNVSISATVCPPLGYCRTCSVQVKSYHIKQHSLEHLQPKIWYEPYHMVHMKCFIWLIGLWSVDHWSLVKISKIKNKICIHESCFETYIRHINA